MNEMRNPDQCSAYELIQKSGDIEHAAGWVEKLSLGSFQEGQQNLGEL